MVEKQRHTLRGALFFLICDMWVRCLTPQYLRSKAPDGQ